MKYDNILTTEELANYLKLNQKTVMRMAKNGLLPGVKIANQWRFYLSAVDEYLQNKAVESNAGFDRDSRALELMPLSRLAEKGGIVLSLMSKNRDGVLRELSNTAKRTGIAVSSEKVFERLKRREEMLTTAVSKGVAFPHPRNPSDKLFKTTGVIIARSKRGVYFSPRNKEKTYLFFMPCASDIVLHIKLLSRIACLLNDKNAFRDFMDAVTRDDIIKILLENEKDLTGQGA